MGSNRRMVAQALKIKKKKQVKTVFLTAFLSWHMTLKRRRMDG